MILFQSPHDEVKGHEPVDPFKEDNAEPYVDGYDDQSVDGYHDNDFVANGNRLSSMTSPARTGSSSATVDHNARALEPPSSASKSDDASMERFKLQLIIGVATVGATIVLVSIIVAAIVYVCRLQRKPSTPSGTADNSSRTFIKYKNKNGVLLFSTPGGAGVDAADTTAAELERCLSVDDGTPERYVINGNGTATPATPTTPSSVYKTRIYRWDDF